jgi:hypothetical protein
MWKAGRPLFRFLEESGHMEQITRELDGWKIIVLRQNHTALKYKAIATTWAETEWTEGFDPENALTNLADRIGIDRHRMRDAFGLAGEH